MGGCILLVSCVLRRVSITYSSSKGVYSNGRFSVYYLYTFVKRPRLILDFVLTLLFNHIVLTTYYSAALPSSIFFWLIMALVAGIMVIFGEQLCVRREMREGLRTSPPELEELEMGARGSGSRRD